MKKSKTITINADYKYDDDDSAEIREMQQKYEGLKEQLAREEHMQEHEHEHAQEQEGEEARLHEQHKNHNKQMVKKKIYQQQEEEKHNKKIKEQKQKQKEEMAQRRMQQQQQIFKSNEHYDHHTHTHNHNTNNRHHDNGPSGGPNSKILNFPENLPSVLYYDYKTEEHHQHQHQHREQHLKHQKQKQQQHERELKQRQQQQKQKQQLHQQQKQQKKQQHHHSNRHHEYGQVFHTYNLPDKFEDELELGKSDVAIEPSTTFKYFSSGYESINNGNSLSNSDILPEPPTKKPKILTTVADAVDMAESTETYLSQMGGLHTASLTTAITTISTDKSSNTPTTVISSTPLKVSERRWL